MKIELEIPQEIADAFNAHFEYDPTEKGSLSQDDFFIKRLLEIVKEYAGSHLGKIASDVASKQAKDEINALEIKVTKGK